MFRSTATNHIRLMVVGEGGVGKSALVVKYLTGRFIWEYQSDYDWQYNYQTVIDGEQVYMEIIDSLNMDENHIRWAEGFMIVYDVTKPESLCKVDLIKKKLESARIGAKFLPMVIVGNKCDLEHSRHIDKDHAREKALALGAARHVDCSACGAESNVRFAFDELCREVAKVRQRLAQKRERRRSSLSQVRQGLKMLVHTGKTKANYNNSPNSGSSSPIGGLNGRCTNNNNGRKVGKFPQSSPFSTLVSPPMLNDLPEEGSAPFMTSLLRDSDLKRDRESPPESRDDYLKKLPSYQHKFTYVS